jgi:hypothetical protein
MDQTPDTRLSRPDNRSCVLCLPVGHGDPLATIKRTANATTDTTTRGNTDTMIIEIRPFKGDWQCYEGPGVGPYWIGDDAKVDAIGYAQTHTTVSRQPLNTFVT